VVGAPGALVDPHVLLRRVQKELHVRLLLELASSLGPTTLAWPSSLARPPQLVQAAVTRQAAAARSGRRQRSPGRHQARAPMAVAACLALLAPPSWFELAPSRDTPWKHTIQMSSKRQTLKQKILPEYSTDSNKIWTIDARSQDLIDPGKRS